MRERGIENLEMHWSNLDNYTEVRVVNLLYHEPATSSSSQYRMPLTNCKSSRILLTSSTEVGDSLQIVYYESNLLQP